MEAVSRGLCTENSGSLITVSLACEVVVPQQERQAKTTSGCSRFNNYSSLRMGLSFREKLATAPTSSKGPDSEIIPCGEKQAVKQLLISSQRTDIICN